MKEITVIIISWNQKEEAQRCVQAVLEHNPDVQIIFVDNSSIDGTGEWLQDKEFDKIIFDEGVQEYGRALKAVFENFTVEENIILLQPECCVGRNTLHQMVRTLASDSNTGVVGCCGNNLVGEEQWLDITNIESLYKEEAERINERDYVAVGSEGGCFGMRRTLISEVGSFEEHLAHIWGVMIDYQLRALKKGYVNKICRSACVFEQKVVKETDYLLENLMLCDMKLLRKNWKMTYFGMSANYKFVRLLERDRNECFSVLEVGCDMGANLLGIKNTFPNSRIYGLELNSGSADIGKHVAEIYCGNIEEERVPFVEKFDYIIFGDVLEHLHNPQRTLHYCRGLLKEGGRILSSIPNVMHISVMQQLLKGEFRYTDVGLLDRTHIHLFTGKEIVNMFESENYRLELLEGVGYQLTEEQETLKEELLKISKEVSPAMYETFQYTVIAQKRQEC